MNLAADPNTIGPLETFEYPSYWVHGLHGHKFPEEVNAWFSTAVGIELFAVRAPKENAKPPRTNVLPRGREEDRVTGFASEACLHIINETSVDQLRKRVEDKYRDGKVPEDFVCRPSMYKPNIVIRGDTPYEEDNWQEARVGPLLWRTTGPCRRCAQTYVNPDTEQYIESKEPYKTLTEFRSAPGIGIFFGTYNACEVLGTRTDYKRALPARLGYPSFNEATKANPLSTYALQPGKTYVRIHKGDMMCLRKNQVGPWISKISEPKKATVATKETQTGKPGAAQIN